MKAVTIFLLDVNALVALGFAPHQFHRRVALWLSSHEVSLATCAITELGFVRVLAQAPAYGVTVAEARSLLRSLKRSKSFHFSFISDDHDVSRLPDWVKAARQLTDGHLSSLARANAAVLATLDEKIPDSYLIPE
jgi:predicted nucleic acid-binding protein